MHFGRFLVVLTLTGLLCAFTHGTVKLILAEHAMWRLRHNECARLHGEGLLNAWATRDLHLVVRDAFIMRVVAALFWWLASAILFVCYVKTYPVF